MCQNVSMKNLTRLLWMLAWIATAASQDLMTERLKEMNRTCDFFIGEPGWKCNKGNECIPLYFICDGNNQCPHPDVSDEVDGCNMYEETGCNSWNGKRYVKCPHSHRCVRDESDCESSDTDPSGNTTCLAELSGQPQWRCNDGLCIDRQFVCDGHENCRDGSDEVDGCSMFPQSGCASWYSLEHIRCPGNDSICTLPEFADDCRRCHDGGQWRCNSGRCIDASKVYNGIPDCADGSDERSYGVKWWALFTTTMLIAGTAIFLSIVLRMLNNRKNLLHCGFCQSSKSGKIKQFKADGEIGLGETIDSNSEVAKLAATEEETYCLPMQLINLLEKPDCWRKRSYTGKNERSGQHYYAWVHQNPEEYRNLYHYLVFRHASPEKLSRATEMLHRWEIEFHNGNPAEVLKCWRLHLGSSEVLKWVVQSIEPAGFCSKFYNTITPMKNYVRSMRRKLPIGCKELAEQTYHLIKLIYYSVRPFLGACALYFDILKDVTFAYLIYTSLYDMSGGDFLTGDYNLEACILSAIIVAIILVQIAFVFISYVYAIDVFHMCEHKESSLRCLLVRIVAVLLSPLMPAIVLANHVYYSEQEYSLQRTLQTFDTKPGGFLTDDEDEEDECPIEDDCAMKTREEQDIFKVSLFRKIQMVRYHGQLHRRIYSFYRIVQAVLESVTIIVSLVLILIVTSRSGRKINLMLGVEAKIGQFLGITGASSENKKSFLEELDLIRDVTFLTTISYSFIMIVTALARYVYQCKNKNVSLSGQACLGLYFSCQIVARLTVTIALFSTAEMPSISKNAASVHEPVISLLPASLLCCIFFFIHFLLIYLYKWRFVDEFRHENLVVQLVHVITNTLVVIPYMTWDVRPPNSCNSGDNNDPSYIAARQKRIQQRKTSLDDVDLSGAVVGNNEENQPKFGHFRSLSASSFLQYMNRKASTHKKRPTSVEFPDIAGVHIRDKLREEILQIWWSDPQQQVSLEQVKKKLPVHLRSVQPGYIEETYDEMVTCGFINKRLFNPRRTKMEYFWLLSTQLFLNLFALSIEMVGGGIKVREGLYYSWDVRLFSFFLGLLFLALYYKKYHVLRSLTTFQLCGCGFKYLPIFCCFKKEKPMQAIPDDEEMQRCLSDPTELTEFATQTSRQDGSKVGGGEMADGDVNVQTKVQMVTIETQTSVVDKGETDVKQLQASSDVSLNESYLTQKLEEAPDIIDFIDKPNHTPAEKAKVSRNENKSTGMSGRFFQETSV